MSATPETGRWTGRDARKDDVRARIWQELTESGVAVGDVFERIPTFVGSFAAARRLVEDLPNWDDAAVVKTNPDMAQCWIRLAALRAGKTVYAPVPELTRDYPYVELDPAHLRAQGVEFEDVMLKEGFLLHGRPLEWDQMRPMDVFVVGSVAVGADGSRTGKGGGFADLEMGIFRDLGLMSAQTAVITTVHDIQVLDEGLPMSVHDTPLNWIFTPTRTIATTAGPAPTEGVRWDLVQDDQFRDIPFLTALRERLAAR